MTYTALFRGGYWDGETRVVHEALPRYRLRRIPEIRLWSVCDGTRVPEMPHFVDDVYELAARKEDSSGQWLLYVKCGVAAWDEEWF